MVRAAPRPWHYQSWQSHAPNVAALWLVEIAGDAADLPPYAVMPDGCVDLVFRCDSGRDAIEAGQLAVVGVSMSRQWVDIQPGERYVGLRLRPGWAASSLALDLAPLRGCAVDASAASPSLKRLARQLEGCGTLAQVARTLERFAQSNVDDRVPSPRALEAVERITASGGRAGMSQIANAVGCSERSLRRELIAATGVGPKALARIVRFRRALALRSAMPSLRTADLAAECGYADQAHMTREFRALGDITPCAAAPFADDVTLDTAVADSFKTRAPAGRMLGTSHSPSEHS